jgi:hypothetical protein
MTSCALGTARAYPAPPCFSRAMTSPPGEFRYHSNSGMQPKILRLANDMRARLCWRESPGKQEARKNARRYHRDRIEFGHQFWPSRRKVVTV